jgi:hypothetical protein
MKALTWIKTIGLLCILFGVWGGFRFLVNLPTMQFLDFFKGTEPGIPPGTVQWIALLVYFGAFVSALYLTAGIAYLKKWRYAQELIMAALILSMLYSSLPKLLLDSGIFRHIARLGFNYIGAGIDLILLAGVLLLRKYYKDMPKKDIRFVITWSSLRIPITILAGIALFPMGWRLMPATYTAFLPPLTYGALFLIAGLAAGAVWHEKGWKTGLWLGAAALLFYPFGVLGNWFAGGWDFALGIFRANLLTDTGLFLTIFLASCLGCFLGARWQNRRFHCKESTHQVH